tara:strand:- start:3699 stop:3857 length:159 start_codon:yes stop_codon:yes gene_type:complete
MSWEDILKGVTDSEEASRLLSQVIEDLEKGKDLLIITRLKQILVYLEGERMT